MSKRGLGSGLSSLLSTTERPRSAGLREVAVAAIVPNPHQPRLEWNEAALHDLCESVREHGILQPLVVMSLPGGDYQLIAGERRWRAAGIVGLATVPVIVKQASPQEQLELALIENIQRADLHAVEEARAYQALIDEFELTQDEVARRVGKSRTLVAQMLGVLKLPPEVQQEISAGRLKLGHVRPLVVLKDAAVQQAAAAEIARQGMTAREAEAYAADLKEEVARGHHARPKTVPADDAVVARLQAATGSRVEVFRRGQRGRITIHFENEAALEQIVDGLTRRSNRRSA
ncbi:MAG: ParB/RepB/Spo0J family partition protein [Herpetosiphon sp.]